MIITLQTLIFFRQTVLNVLDRILRPYYDKLSVTFGKTSDISEEDEPEEQVFSEFDDEKGVVFYPPVYLQRYAAVSDCLLDDRWSGKLHKVVELGYHDLSFIKYLKEVPGIRCILAVDIESAPLHCSTDLVGYEDYGPKRDSPLQITLFQGNAADPDYRLIGCDAVIAIEMIEHMLPHDLDRLIHTVFGFIKPWIVVFTTPNADFNVLFKALGKNGLRRWDHYFEWTREQFHDWCSNIVLRYENYTVSCKGIGPGPPGTIHLGCCSQMAIFISKDYNKQQDLSINSLALVSGNAPNPEMTNLIGTWGKSEVPSESNMLCPADNIDSFAELTHTFEQSSENKSCLALMYTSQKNSNTHNSVDTHTESLLRKTAISLAPFAQHDKTSQCNLDVEACKNYRMLDYEQMCYDIIVPRQQFHGRVYMIEDVNNRLNCTSIHVKSFSKTTQNLINQNKDLALVHTREVVDEIRHLTKMLNFNKDNMGLETQENGVQHWRNINWGVDAPYWNQYYKVVKEYNSPYEIKSEECRITELISDEINRLIDSQFDDIDLNRLEIPIEQLMPVVSHITKDVEKVKDLLEWDGYEIVDNLVIHSRIVVDTVSTRMTNDDDWPENETYSDWESTEVRSTTLSDGSTVVPDHHAKCLRRALDQKVRKLRTMLTADEDISTELDKVVCRLLKLALRTSEGRRQPPPSKWLQCKLLDLLTLTEKAIQRRKRHSVENTISQSVKALDFTALEKIKEDDTASKIVDKYKYLVNSENPRAIKDSRNSAGIYGLLNREFDDDLSVPSADYITNYKYADLDTGFELEPNLQEIALLDPTDKKSKLERTQAWLEEDVKPTEDRSSNIEMNFDNDVSSGGDTEHSTSHRYYKESYRRYKKKNKFIELKCVICKKSHSKNSENDSTKHRASKNQSSKTKIVKKMTKKKSNSNNVATDSSTKYVSVGYRQYRVKTRKKEKPLQPTASKPIPASLIELCHPELVTDNIDVYKGHANECIPDEHVAPPDKTHGISATEHSNLIEIITAETRETIAMNRTIGTGSEEAMTFENETVIRDNVFDKHDAETDEYQTIFLNDINEPSTSKGIRHISMDVQCGPDVSAPDYLLSATTSTRMDSIFNSGIRIGDSSTNTKVQNTFNCTEQQLKSTTNCCTSTYFEEGNFGILTPRKVTTGIKIKDIPNGAEQVELPVTLEQDSMTDSRQGSPIHVKQLAIPAKLADCSSKVQNTFICADAQLKSTINCTSTNLEEGDSGILKFRSLGARQPMMEIKIKNKLNGIEQVERLVTLEQDSMADIQGSPIPVKQFTGRAKSADCSGSSAMLDRRATVIPISNLPRMRRTSKLQKNDLLKLGKGLMPMKQRLQFPQSDKNPDMEPIFDSPMLCRRSLIPQKQDSPTRKPGSARTPKNISPNRRHISITPKNESITPRSTSPILKQKQPTKRKVISPKSGYQCSNTQRAESRLEQEPYNAQRPESPIQLCKKSKIPRLDSPRAKSRTPMIRQQHSPVKNTRYSMIPRRESPYKLGSPTRLYAPNTQNSPNRLISPNRHNASNRLNSPDIHNAPNRLDSPNILNSSNRVNSPNQYLNRKSESPTIGKTFRQRSKSPIQTPIAQTPPTKNRNLADMHYKPIMACEREFSFGKNCEIDWINSILSVPPTQDLNLPLMQKKLPTVAQEREFNSTEKQEIGQKNSDLSINTKFSEITKCLKSVPSSIKMDSGTEFYGSFASMPKTTLSLGNCDLNTTPLIKKDVGDTRKLTRYIRPKLCYGGVQVHSYRDKESSEDVMFQGRWQNYRPKVFTKRKIGNPVKRITESVSKRRICPKEKISLTSYLRKNIPNPQKNPSVRKIEQVKLNQSVVKNEYIPKAVGNNKKPFRNVVKAPSKLTMGSAAPRYNTKSVFLVINPSKVIPTHKDDIQTNKALTTTKYLPPYLRKKSFENKQKPKTRDKCILNLSQHSSKTYISTKINCQKPIDHSHAEKIKMDLLKLQNRLTQPNYIVLRNEIEQNSSNNRTAKKTDSVKRRCGPSVTRNQSPQSPHSSTCSSNSVATVRAVASLSKNVSSHRHSNSSYRSSTANSSSESSTPNRNKKFIKRCKNQKIPDEKKFDNKENIPQSSRQSNSCGSKGCDKKSKGAFPTQQKVLIAHLKESPPLHTANKKPKSNVNLTKTDSLIEKKSKSPSISKVSSLKSEDLIPTYENTVGASTGTSNMVLVLEPQRAQEAPSTSTPMRDGRTADWMNTLCNEAKMLHVENVETAMKNIVVKALDFIDEPLGSCSSVSSSTVILKREDNNTGLLDLTSSPISFKTVITNDEDTSFQNNLENALYRSFDNESSSSVVSLTADTRMAVTDFDMVSFKSSTTFSKLSGHGSARSSRVKLASNSLSVKDIYERKDQPFAPVPQNNASAVANQAFSGFSLDVDLIGGDKPDPINLIDSETGSLAAAATRQANSEELFVSGRSSDSFQSCAVDDDTVVPGWLFQIISQQQAAEEYEPDPPLPALLPMPDNAMFDVNGNDSIGMGAGAGDGRGIHSDLSQDSSGRGSSLSSSVTSSGQSGAIFLDPSAFVAQFEGGPALLQDSEDSSLVFVGVTEDGFEIVVPDPVQNQSVHPATPSFTRDSRRPHVDVTSDADADVSSLDTDVPDSS